MAVHSDLGAARQHEARQAAELSDEAENVVPAAAVQARRVLAKLPQNLVHFESGKDGFDEHGSPYGAPRDTQFLLRQEENVVPQAGFQMAFQFGQIEIRSCAVRDQVLGIVKEEQAEIEERGRDGFAIHQKM